MRQRLYIDTTGWFGGTEDLSMLPIVQEAVARDRKLKIRYSNRRSRFEPGALADPGAASSERIIDPLGLVAKGSTWYLVANTGSGFRTFRLSRIQNALLLDLSCERPANFDLESHWRSATEDFLKNSPRFEAILRLHPDAAREIRTWRMAMESPPDTRNSPHDGWTTLRVQFEDEYHAAFVARAFGARAEVVAPAGLRNRLRSELEASLQQYESTSASHV